MRYFIIAVVMAVLGMAGFIFNSKLLRQDVVVEAVEIDTARAVIPGTIRVEASYDTAIRSDEAGRILEVLVEEGQEVSEGDTVARMDTGDLELELEALQIN
ncbi:MAG: biotin/lipoyl-binding protein, partial [Opitutae bacterium]|nr:biotin/lipoyl-binding protein [Opitutae bacterium]